MEEKRKIQRFISFSDLGFNISELASKWSSNDLRR
jgi:hypothetical protein